MPERNVAILIFDDVEELDFVGPFEVFSGAARRSDPPAFAVYTVAEKAGPIRTRGGLIVTPHYTLADCPRPDILLIPGGQGTRALLTHTDLLVWIAAQANRVEHLLSVCTGALVLGRAGLLDGLEVTTHHSAFDLLRSEAPDATVYENRRFVDNGKVVTSAGISAGIDMALHMVARLAGLTVAEATARNMEYPWQPEKPRPVAAVAGRPGPATELPMQLDSAPWRGSQTYQNLWDAVNAAAARWVWTDGPHFDPRPEHFRRQNQGRGRRLASEPEEKAGHYLYALDGAGRVLFSRYYFENGEMLEQFHRHADHGLEIVAYTLGATLPVLESVTQITLADGRPQSYSQYVMGETTNALTVEPLICTYRELYAYAGARLAHIRVIQLDYAQQISALYEEFLAYDEVGRLDNIQRQYSAEEAYIVYQRPRRGQTLAALRDSIRQRLLALVPQAVDGLADEVDPLYVLALIYDLDDENCLPPTLAAGSADSRTMLIQEHGEEVANYLWDPEEFRQYGLGEAGFIALDELDELLADDCFMLNQQLSFLDRWELARDLTNEVARELGRALPGRLGRRAVSDFVVYAVDTGFEDFDDNFAYSVPPALVETLAAEGLF